MSRYKKIFEKYLLEDELSLGKLLMPQYYFKGKDKIDINIASRFLQNELNELSNSFLNGGFSKLGYALYPIIKDVSPENKNRIKRIQKIVMALDDNYDFSASIKAFKNKLDSRGFASILSCLYMDLSKIKVVTKKEFLKPACNSFRSKLYKKSKYFKPLIKLDNYSKKELEEYLSGFYIHGSFATKDYVEGWSDVDTTAIVSKRTLSNPVKIIELRDRLYLLRKFFYKIDPLQHHGVILISEYDLDRYCQAYFPTEIFRYSNSLLDHDKKYMFKLRDYKLEAVKKFFWFVNYFRSLKINRNYVFNSYDMKNFLHSITLFPSLYLQARGKPTFKKHSFAIVKKEFNKRLFAPIDYVSTLRNRWVGNKTLPFLGIISGFNPLLAYMASSRIMDKFHNISTLNKIDSKYLVERMFSFSENAWGIVKKDVTI
jgi:predicted nucleotidyltransferase